MTLGARDKRALAGLGVTAVVSLAVYLWPSPDAAATVVATTGSIPLAEKRLARLRQVAATVPGKTKTLESLTGRLGEREKGFLQADTGPQAQAQLLQVMRRLSQQQAPPLEIRAVELGQIRPLGNDYGEAVVSVSFDCRIEQLVNLLADIARQADMIATSEIRIGAGDAKQKSINVRISVSGVVPRKLVPERKGLF